MQKKKLGNSYLKNVDAVTDAGTTFNILKEPAPEIDKAGTKRWLNKNGKRHRDNDLPAVIHAYGDRYWYKDGKLHRENGPAVIWADGTKRWWLNGERHREDGPAVIRANGRKEYWLNGVRQNDK